MLPNWRCCLLCGLRVVCVVSVIHALPCATCMLAAMESLTRCPQSSHACMHPPLQLVAPCRFQGILLMHTVMLAAMVLVVAFYVCFMVAPYLRSAR